MSTAAAVRRVIVGTAGHIDHGKTSLVERLTGIRTDRLPEEKERGMTLDVGYAEFPLPDGTEVGLIDVPGHERLVRTMVAGATSMDLVLLVVAADDGPMLQTREHVDILDLLGVRRAVVALTKIDLVDAEQVGLAEELIVDMLKGTTLEGAPVLRVSSTTGAGVDALKQALVDAIPPLDDRGEDPRAFRMPILRGFSSPGRGTVVTGIPVAGRIAEGDAVEILPVKWACRVKGVQVHHRDAKEAKAGHRAALAVSDVDATQVKRGMVVAAAGALTPVPRFSARLRVLARVEAPLTHGMAVRVHVGSDQMAARLHLLEGDALLPGAVSAVELQGERPFLVAPGDRYVLRAENASATLGGGVVVERLEQRLPRRREGIVKSILERADRVGDPFSLVAAALAAAGDRGTDAADVSARTVLRADSMPVLIDGMVAAGRAVRAGRGRLFDPAAYARLRKRLLDAATGLHKKDAALPHFPVSSLRAAAGRVEPQAFDAALEDLVKSGDLRRTPEGGIFWKGHASDMPAADRERCDRVLGELKKGASMPPEEGEIQAALNLAPQVVKKTLLLLEARREVLRAGSFWFAGAFVEEAKAKLTALGRRGDGFTASEAREALATTRKFIIPLLEALDDKGFTKRTGDRRTLKA